MVSCQNKDFFWACSVVSFKQSTTVPWACSEKSLFYKDDAKPCTVTLPGKVTVHWVLHHLYTRPSSYTRGEGRGGPENKAYTWNSKSAMIQGDFLLYRKQILDLLSLMCCWICSPKWGRDYWRCQVVVLSALEKSCCLPTLSMLLALLKFCVQPTNFLFLHMFSRNKISN